MKTLEDKNESPIQVRRFSLAAACAIAAVISISSTLAAETPVTNTDPLPSPYFVDGILCEGVRSPELTEGWLLPKDAVSTFQEVEKQKGCEETLAHYGITKYMWLNLADLERFELEIKESGHFKSAELSVKKSELKNHVHVVLKVVPVLANKLTVSNDLTLPGAGSQSKGRIDERFTIMSTSREFAPRAEGSWGLNIDYLKAFSTWEPEDHSPYPEDLEQFQTLTNQANVDLFAKQKIGYNNRQSLELLEQFSYEGGNGYGRLNFTAQADYLFSWQARHTLGTFSFGPSLLVPGTPIFKDDFNYSGLTLMAGVRARYLLGRQDANFLNFDYKYHWGGSGASTYASLLHARYFPKFLGGDRYFIFGSIDGIIGTRVMTAELLSRGSGRGITYSEAGLGIRFGSPESAKTLQLAYGGERRLGYRSAGAPDSGYLGAKFNLADESLNLNLGFKYVFERTY